mgnify:CR=1 FL=1
MINRCTPLGLAVSPCFFIAYVIGRFLIQIKMAKEYIKIELTEDDIKKMVAEKYNLDINRTTINVSHYAGDAREPAYTSIVVTGQRDGGV